jgi:carboxyl-terminal processing protease
VEASLLLKSGIGYIKINRFSATTYDEFSESLKKLKTKGASSIILDLRQNPGGYLDAATSIADEFLDDQKLIVYTKGRNSLQQEYRAAKPGQFEKGKIVVLVDESSASASEILAGAIQDWDRGVVIGRRTFGKGLVQEQYDMDNGSALRLTIAKYYTPSGRSIQRSYSKGKKAYAEEFTHRLTSGELTTSDSSYQAADTQKYYTSNKRVVYGGGGIQPDILIPYDTTRLNNNLLNLVFSESSKNILWDYFIRHRAELKKYKTVEQFNVSFDVRQLIESFVALAPKELTSQLVKVLDQRETRYYFELQLKAQIARFLFRNNGYYAVYSQGDPVVQKALEVLRSETYSAIVRR